MKNTIIADSSGIISAFSPDDNNHIIAIKVSKKISQENRTICIPSDIFSETLNVVGKKISHTTAYALGDHLLHDKRFLVIDATSSLREKALDKLKTQPGSVSFTDCIVMAFADQFETKEIFGFDEAFRKNGYVRLGFLPA